jgi:ERCC4-type nuclease
MLEMRRDPDLNIYIDTREFTRPSLRHIQKLARELGFIPMALECGDYSTDKLIVERKEIGDFTNSTFARYGTTSRLIDQCDRIFAECQKTERIPLLLITGKLSDVEKQFRERGQSLNRNAIFGSFASIWVRYAFNIIWTEQPPEEWLPELKLMAEKIDEGKYLLPQQKKLKEFSSNRNIAVIARALDLNPKDAEILVKRFKNLAGVLDAASHRPSEILVLENFGTRKLAKIQELGGTTS